MGGGSHKMDGPAVLSAVVHHPGLHRQLHLIQVQQEVQQKVDVPLVVQAAAGAVGVELQLLHQQLCHLAEVPGHVQQVIFTAWARLSTSCWFCRTSSSISAPVQMPRWAAIYSSQPKLGSFSRLSIIIFRDRP